MVVTQKAGSWGLQAWPKGSWKQVMRPSPSCKCSATGLHMLSLCSVMRQVCCLHGPGNTGSLCAWVNATSNESCLSSNTRTKLTRPTPGSQGTLLSNSPPTGQLWNMSPPRMQRLHKSGSGYGMLHARFGQCCRRSPNTTLKCAATFSNVGGCCGAGAVRLPPMGLSSGSFR